MRVKREVIGAFLVLVFILLCGLGYGDIVVPLFTKTPSLNTVDNGTTFTYTITFNLSDSTAQRVTINETYPASASYVSAIPAPNVSNNIWLYGNVTNRTETIVITMRADSNLPNGTVLENFVNLSYFNGTHNLSLTNSSNVTVLVPFDDATIAVVKADSPDPVHNGSFLNYTITVTNNGPGNALNVTLVETYDARITFVEATPANNTLNTWNLGNLTNGQNSVVEIKVRVNSAIANGTELQNDVNITYNNATNGEKSIATTENTTVILKVGQPSIALTKTDSADPVSPGDTLVYYVTITNTGGNATNVTLFEVLDPNITYSSSTPTNTSINQWFLGNFTPGESRQVNITVQANSTAGPITDVATNLVRVEYRNSSWNKLSNTATETTTRYRQEAIHDDVGGGGSAPGYSGSTRAEARSESHSPKKTFSFTDWRGGLYEIEISSVKDIEDATANTELIGSRYDRSPFEKLDHAYEYWHISVRGVDETDYPDAIFKFDVPRYWMERIELPPDRIVLKRWNGKEWEDYVTHVVSKNDQEVRYRATGRRMDGYFAVGRKTVSISAPLYAEGISEKEETKKAIVTKKEPIEEKEEVKVREEADSKFSYFTIMVVVLIASLIGICGYVAYDSYSNPKKSALRGIVSIAAFIEEEIKSLCYVIGLLFKRVFRKRQGPSIREKTKSGYRGARNSYHRVLSNIFEKKK